MFSNRLDADAAPNNLARAIERCRADGREIVDLTQSNPTRAGFDYPADLLGPLASPRALTYAPEPLGAGDARSAIAGDYARRGVAVRPERIVLTASTSDAYSLLFKVLCDPGDEVLVPRPSYPLFEHLTRLDAVVAKPYDLEYHGGWRVDVASIDAARTPRTRALLAVHPNNPTGSFVKPLELDRICEICRPAAMALIGDEVFADYELAPGGAACAARLLERPDVLVFSLGGLSKTVGLPQVKLGWIAVGGPPGAVQQALKRLELACDTYLSVSTPVQGAAAELLERGTAVRRAIQARVRSNYSRLTAAATEAPACRVLHAEAGWYAVVQVPSFGTEEELVVDLLVNHGVLTHPGYFFDFPRESFLILSLLAPEATFREGAARVFRHFDCSERISP
jgi:aspartate/methionine/tyrosine aminotransferase